jgi:SPP1 family predicted phage head-tail adaptor
VTSAGDLNRRLRLQEPVESDDGAGGVIRGFADVTTLWAQVTPVSARAEIAADSLGDAQRFTITIRRRDDITTRHRFAEGARLYRIVAVQESADRQFLVLQAEIRGD